jgi:hypothetical protein
MYVGYVAFLAEILTPFAGLATVVHPLIIAKLVGSMLGNLRGLGLAGPGG